jgi:hypothetical protein
MRGSFATQERRQMMTSRTMQTILLCLVVLALLVYGRNPGMARQAIGSGKAAVESSPGQDTASDILAIDVLLVPDRAMIEAAKAANARLRQHYPDGYELDASHAPHVTLLQRFVRARDFDSVTAAVAKVLAAEKPTRWQLKATGYEYVIWAGVAVTAIVVERSADLMRLQQKVIDAVAPFAVSGGTAAAFATSPGPPDINAETVGYVETFVPKSSGKNYQPHVTVGVAQEDFVKRMKAEPYHAFTFKPDGAAIYQLGNFGTAQKKLWDWTPKR